MTDRQFTIGILVSFGLIALGGLSILARDIRWRRLQKRRDPLRRGGFIT
jgi:hypothetical protein